MFLLFLIFNNFDHIIFRTVDLPNTKRSKICHSNFRPPSPTQNMYVCLTNYTSVDSCILVQLYDLYSCTTCTYDLFRNLKHKIVTYKL